MRRQAKSYAPELHIDDWIKVRSTDKFTVYRVPMADRNAVIKNRGIYTKAQRLRAHDYLNIRGPRIVAVRKAVVITVLMHHVSLPNAAFSVVAWIMMLSPVCIRTVGPTVPTE